MSKSADAFRTISEVADVLATPAHVLRFWESKFTQIKPVKRAGGRRYYRPADVALLGGIKQLLHEDGLTIRGVQKILKDQGVKHVSSLARLPDDEGGDAADVMGMAEVAEASTAILHDTPPPAPDAPGPDEPGPDEPAPDMPEPAVPGPEIPQPDAPVPAQPDEIPVPDLPAPSAPEPEVPGRQVPVPDIFVPEAPPREFPATAPEIPAAAPDELPQDMPLEIPDRDALPDASGDELAVTAPQETMWSAAPASAAAAEDAGWAATQATDAASDPDAPEMADPAPAKAAPAQPSQAAASAPQAAATVVAPPAPVPAPTSTVAAEHPSLLPDAAPQPRPAAAQEPARRSPRPRSDSAAQPDLFGAAPAEASADEIPRLAARLRLAEGKALSARERAEISSIKTRLAELHRRLGDER
ncbi:MerR family transcriptional regulator [Phaeovulum sp. W22_SRMD_FR3]|uniref:MerR family transcriptional regulator n=1 Tax=Phaeovulum sp. W22_SRMD_FR3 TaxID=3240274 RepID=UPI003F9C6F38